MKSSIPVLLGLAVMLGIGIRWTLAAPLSEQGAGTVTAAAATVADVDLAACRTIRAQDSEPATQRDISRIFDHTDVFGWMSGDLKDRRRLPIDFLIVFKRPVAVGSVEFSGTVRNLKLWTGNAAVDPADAHGWRAVAVPGNQSGGGTVALPVGTQIRALLLTDPKPWGPARLTGLRLLKSRLFSVTPAALAFADGEWLETNPFGPPFLHAASLITRGGREWQNTGDNGHGRVPRPPISDLAPSWFMLTWSQPQSIQALWMIDNFEEVQVDSYVGPETLNPRAGTAKEWQTIGNARQVSGAGRMIEFAQPVLTRGIRITILKSQNGPTARLYGLHALTDLKDQPIPSIALAASGDNTAPPVRIPFTMEFDGKATIAINAADGHRVRNLIARVDLKKGRQEIGWDLKDEMGVIVPPASYTWKLIAAPPLNLRYEMTAYPNVHENSPENPPWHTSMSGPGGWMADHTQPRAGATSGNYVFLGSPVSESGVSMAVCDLTGRKLWAVPSFAGFTGSHVLAADEKTVYSIFMNASVADETKVETLADRIWAVNIATHEVKEIARLRASAGRKRSLQAAAAFNNTLYLSIDAPVDWLETAVSTGDVDINNCYPRYAEKRKPKVMLEDVPDPRGDFLALFRTTANPPRSTALQSIESAPGRSPRHHVVLAFRKPTSIGSIVLPRPRDPAVHVKLSVLKADAPYPPNAGDPRQWESFESQPKAGWDVTPAPKNCLTRALRVSFIRGDEDPGNEADESAEYSASPLAGKLEFKTPDKQESNTDSASWIGTLEGLKIIGHRFENIAPLAQVMVSSGSVDAEGVWDARRTAPLSESDPATYSLQWARPQPLRGLAIKEIDGAKTEIDVYVGPDSGSIDPASANNWKNVSTYLQPRRTHHMLSSNESARYLDGYIDFGKEIVTRAVRLRVVAQWSSLENETALRWDLHDKLDPARCRIFGVAALKYIGGETEDSGGALTFQRIEALDGTTGAVTREIAIEHPGPLAVGTGGELFAVSGHDLVKVNLTGGAHQKIVSGDLLDPQSMAIDHAGNFYVFDHAADRRNIRVYAPGGKLLREIGTPGGFAAGAWDPHRFSTVRAMMIDRNDQLWAVENTWMPKRVSRWSLDGTWQKDFLGNTVYGGGGVLDPYDKRRLFYGPLEFELDWQTGHSRLKNLTWLGKTPAGEVPIVVNDRLYLTTRGVGSEVSQKVGIVYLYEKDHLRLAAAVGRADAFAPLSEATVLAGLKTRSLAEHDFVWSDLNGDGQVQSEEVTLLPRLKEYGLGISLFNDDLGVQESIRRFEVQRFLPTGVPIYQAKDFPGLHGLSLYRLNDGNFHTIGDHSPEILMNAQGKPIWTYPAEGWTTFGYADAKPYSPGQVVAQFNVIGHDTAHAGDLGEFLIINTNMGVWNIWTADGLLAGTIFNDQRLPGMRSWTMAEHERGMKMDDVTIGQEHYQGHFCRTSDNHYYAVAGHNHISVVEVLGMERFRRQSGIVEVTAPAIAQTATWEIARQKQRIEARTPVIDCYHIATPPKIDGSLSEWDTDSTAASIGEREDGTVRHGADFHAAWDEHNLYLAYEVNGLGPMKNSGEQWDRLFKTGAAVDLQIGVDPAASPTRSAPAAGDKRLLMTFTGPSHQPAAVLYEAVVPGTPADAAWKAVSPVGQVSFDRVRKVDTVQLAYKEDRGRYVVEAAIPLEVLGLHPAENLRLKMDWGMLVTDDSGNSVIRRIYWSNQATAIVADVPSEARLQPDLWGYVLFHDAGRRGIAELPTELKLRTNESKPSSDTAEEKLLNDFERDLKK